MIVEHGRFAKSLPFQINVLMNPKLPYIQSSTKSRTRGQKREEREEEKPTTRRPRQHNAWELPWVKDVCCARALRHSAKFVRVFEGSGLRRLVAILQPEVTVDSTVTTAMAAVVSMHIDVLHHRCLQARPNLRLCRLHGSQQLGCTSSSRASTMVEGKPLVTPLAIGYSSGHSRVKFC